MKNLSAFLLCGLGSMLTIILVMRVVFSIFLRKNYLLIIENKISYIYEK